MALHMDSTANPTKLHELSYRFETQMLTLSPQWDQKELLLNRISAFNLFSIDYEKDEGPNKTYLTQETGHGRDDQTGLTIFAHCQNL